MFRGLRLHKVMRRYSIQFASFSAVLQFKTCESKTNTNQVSKRPNRIQKENEPLH